MHYLFYCVKGNVIPMFRKDDVYVCERTLETNYIFHGKVLSLRIDSVELPNGGKVTREVVEHPGAVAILAFTKDRKVILIKQYRKATEEVLWEVPAGKLKPGEDPRACAARELEEETGFTAKSWQKLISFYTTPGFSNEILHLYLAHGLESGDQLLEPDEEILIYILPLSEALGKLSTNEIRDAKTIIALLLAKQLMEI
jgi:ADP-ribose pyrophosphatase